jgi:hypothetical protein
MYELENCWTNFREIWQGVLLKSSDTFQYLVKLGHEDTHALLRAPEYFLAKNISNKICREERTIQRMLSASPTVFSMITQKGTNAEQLLRYAYVQQPTILFERTWDYGTLSIIIKPSFLQPPRIYPRNCINHLRTHCTYMSVFEHGTLCSQTERKVATMYGT